MASGFDQKARLYLISPEKLVLSEFLPRLEAAFRGGDIAAFQLRLKGYEESEVKVIATELMPLCRSKNCAFIINDYPHLAADLRVDGLHLGDEDMPVNEARKIIGDDIIIGASCYGSFDRAIDECEKGADYVAFGQFYETKTKPAKGKPSPEIIERWSSQSTIPCVAIGGIKHHNLAPLVKAGADFIAVVTAVWDYVGGEEKAVRELNQAISAAI